MVIADARVVRADRIGRTAARCAAYVQSEGDKRRLKAMLFRAEGSWPTRWPTVPACRSTWPATCGRKAGTAR